MSNCSGVVASTSPARAPVVHPQRREPMAITPATAAMAARIGTIAALDSVTRPNGREASATDQRSEERRVGKECRSTGLPYQYNKKDRSVRTRQLQQEHRGCTQQSLATSTS